MSRNDRKVHTSTLELSTHDTHQPLAYKALRPFAKRRYREEDWLLALLVHDEAAEEDHEHHSRKH
jgi:hypothetical protein